MAVAADVLPVVQPAAGVPGPPQGSWSYAEYARLPDDGRRYEIIDGVLYVAPSPNTSHQDAARWFVYYLTQHVHLAGRGRIFSAPFDGELTARDVVQPDVIVVLAEHAGSITPSRIIGAPDPVIGTASPGTAGYDRRQNQDACARAGVRECWIPDPATRTIEMLVLEASAYRSLGVFHGQAMLPSQVVAGLPVRAEQFFVE